MISRLIDGIITIIFIIIGVIIFGAEFRSCIVCVPNQDKNSAKIEIREYDINNPRDRKIKLSLYDIWSVIPNIQVRPELFIAESNEINAASFGGGRFIFFDGVAILHKSEIDAIVAHEVSHDLLKHSRKANEIKDLNDFIVEVIAFIFGSSRPAEKTLKGWMDKAMLPKYSRSQEFDADKKAIELLALRGYRNPQKTFRKALQILLEKYGNTGGGFFDNHPSTQERIRALTR